MLAKIVNLATFHTSYKRPLMSQEFIFLELELACLLERCELDVTACLVQSTGELKKDLPFIVNHENLNLTGITQLLGKSKVRLRFFIPGYFLIHSRAGRIK